MHRLIRILVAATVVLLAAASPAGACGPPRARTLARDGQARVYVVQGDALACHRDRERPWSLGPAKPVVEVKLAGRFAAVVRASPAGQTLRVYDLRAARPTTGVRSVPGGTISALALDPGGPGAYIASYADGAEVRDIHDNSYGGRDEAIDRTFLALAGTQLAVRVRDHIAVPRLWGGATARRTLLLRDGDVRLYVKHEHLVATYRDGRPVLLGPAIGACESHEGCYGIPDLAVAGRFVATEYIDTGNGGAIPNVLTVRDLAARTFNQPCWGYVESYVLTDAGHTACAMTLDRGAEVVSNGAVIDSGSLDAFSLIRRGDELVWLHDGVERTAPLP